MTDMGNSETARDTIRGILIDEDRSYAWLSRETGIPYKTLLRQAKYGSRPLTFDNVVRIAGALGVTVPDLARAA